MTPADQPSGTPSESASEANKGSALAEFARSALYAAAVEPARGVAQIVDQIAPTHWDAAVQSAAASLVGEPSKPAEFGTAAWTAQQLGGAVGMMVPFKFLHSGTTRLLGAAATESQVGSSLLAMSAREASLSATTGFVYGSFFSPSDPANIGTSSFFTDRLKGGAADAGMFGTLGLVNPIMARGFSSLATKVEASSLTPLIQTPLSALLKGPVLPGMASGVPLGAVNAEAGALKDGRWTPTGTELAQNIASMTMVGGAFSTAHWLTATRPGTDSSNAGYYAGRVKTAATFGLDRTNMALQRGVPVERYANYFDLGNAQTAPSMTDLAATLPGYRVQVDRSITTPHIDHAAARINLPVLDASSAWRMPAADPASFVHEMAQGPLPGGTDARTLSQPDYINWRLQREQSARLAERQTLQDMGRTNRASRIELDGDKILNAQTTPGRTYRDGFIADWTQAQGRTDVPFTEYSGSPAERALKMQERLTQAHTTLAEELSRNAGETLLSQPEIDSIETLANLTPGQFDYASQLKGRGPLALEMANIAASVAQHHAEGYENHEWRPETLRAAVWARDAIKRVEERSGRPIDQDDDSPQSPIWQEPYSIGRLFDAGVTDEASVKRWAETFYKLDTENARRLHDSSSMEPTIFGASVEGAKRFSEVPGIENMSASSLLNIYAKLEGEDISARELSTAFRQAGNAWEVDARFPYRLALQIGEKPLKERIAASVALDELLRSDAFYEARQDYEDSHRQERTGRSRDMQRIRNVRRRQEMNNRYNSARDERILESGVVDDAFQDLWKNAATRNRTELVSNLSPRSAIGPAVDLIHSQVLSEADRQQLANAMQNAQEPFQTMASIRAASFAPALEYLRQGEATTGGSPDQPWIGHAAAGLSLTFKGGWRDWLTAQQKRGISNHDATYWLPLAPAEQLPDLSGFLMRNQKEDPQLLESIANRWSDVPAEMRKGSADTILDEWGVGHYEDVRSEKFAAQAKQWLVPKADYNELEDWFLDTQEVPVPFPVDRSWSDGNLTGRFLPRSDVRGPFLGKYAKCCQHVVNSIGASSARYGQESEKAGFYVVEDKSRKDHVVAIALAWQGPNGQVVFDNVEASGLGDKQQAVRRILKNTATDLLATHPLVTLGTGHSDLDLTGLAPAGELTVATPEGVYTDAKQQVVLAQR